MIKVVVPVAVMMLIILWKKIPKIGGNIHAALIVAGIYLFSWVACTQLLSG